MSWRFRDGDDILLSLLGFWWQPICYSGFLLLLALILELVYLVLTIGDNPET